MEVYGDVLQVPTDHQYWKGHAELENKVSNVWTQYHHSATWRTRPKTWRSARVVRDRGRPIPHAHETLEMQVNMVATKINMCLGIASARQPIWHAGWPESSKMRIQNEDSGFIKWGFRGFVSVCVVWFSEDITAGIIFVVCFFHCRNDHPWSFIHTIWSRSWFVVVWDRVMSHQHSPANN